MRSIQSISAVLGFAALSAVSAAGAVQTGLVGQRLQEHGLAIWVEQYDQPQVIADLPGDRFLPLWHPVAGSPPMSTVAIAGDLAGGTIVAMQLDAAAENPDRRLEPLRPPPHQAAVPHRQRLDRRPAPRRAC